MKAKPGSKYKFDVVITENADDRKVPVSAQLHPYNAEPRHDAQGGAAAPSMPPASPNGSAPWRSSTMSNFPLENSEAVGIVGPNGAGKTTLLNVLAGSLPPVRRECLFRGADVTRLDAADALPARHRPTHQIPRPFGGMTVFENVYRRRGGRRQAKGAKAYRSCVEFARAVRHDPRRQPPGRGAWPARSQAARTCARARDRARRGAAR